MNNNNNDNNNNPTEKTAVWGDPSLVESKMRLNLADRDLTLPHVLTYTTWQPVAGAN